MPLHPPVMTSDSSRLEADPHSLIGVERWALMVVLAMAVARAVVAATAPLSSDEAYYWLWTRPLALSYYDHPAMVAYWIWAGVHVLGDNWAGVRLAAVLGSVAVTVLIWDGARLAFRSRAAGAWAALWINATVLFGSVGVIITPDSPLLLCWSLLLWALIRLIVDGRTRFIYAAGAALGLGALSKYTMALAIPGVVLTFLCFPALRPWVGRLHTWGAALLALAFTMPVVAWNYLHQWASFDKQLTHAFAGPETHGSLPTFVASQIGVVTPLIFVFCLWGMVWALIRGWREKRPEWFLLGTTSLPLLLFFAEHAVTGTVQAHWSGPAYVAATIAAVGAFLSRPRSRGARLWFITAPMVGLVLTLLVFLQATTAALPLPAKADPLKRLGGWPELAAAIQEERVLHPGAFLFTEKHDPTGPVSFYLPDHPPVFLQGRIRPSSIGAADVAALRGKDGIFVTRSRDGRGTNGQGQWFQAITPLRHVELHWGGRVVDAYDLYLGQGYKGGAFVMGDGVMGARDTPP